MIRIEKNKEITTVIIDRPDVRNAVDRPTADALSVAFREFDADEEARVAVLWGDHGTFCAGADLKAVASGERRNRTEATGDGPMGPSRMTLSKPVIAAVSGHAVAGGLELAAWCDLRVVEEDAVMGVFCRRWGVPLIDGGCVRLPKLIGLSHALDLILTGRPIDAAEAHRIGLANRIVPTGKAREAAEELASEMARFPQACMRADRLSAIETSMMDDIAEAMRVEFERGEKVLQSEALSGARRFADGAGRHGSFDDLE